MKIKLKNILMISFLAVAGIFGVSSALINKQVEEKPIVEKATADTSYTFNYAVTSAVVGSYTVKLNINTGTGWKNYDMSKIDRTYLRQGTTYDIYSYTFSDSATDFWTVQFQLYDGGTWKGEQTPVNNVQTTLTSWDNSLYVHNIGKKTRRTITKKRVTSGTQYNIITQYAWDDETFNVPNGYYVANYTFNGWYSDSTLKTPLTSKTISANLTIYGDYTNHGAWTGSVLVDLKNSGWQGLGANYAIYFWNSTLEGSANGWSNYVTGTATGKYLVEGLTYSLGFEPTNLLVMRYNSSYPKSSWDSEKWSSNVWNRSNDGVFSDFIAVDGSNNIVSSAQPHLMGQPSGGSWGDVNYPLYSYKINSSSHVEFYNVNIELDAGTQFKMNQGGSYYAAFSTESELGSCFSGDQHNNITVNTTGTYSIFFDSTNNTFFITNPDLITRTWANSFLSGVKCNSSGATAPTGWSTLASSWSSLSQDVKDVFLSIEEGGNESGTKGEQAIARYDYIIKKYGKSSYSDFMGRNLSSYRVSAHNFSPLALFGTEEDMSTIIVIVASSVAFLSITALSILVIRKRKSKQE